MISVTWKQGLTFEASAETGATLTLASHTDGISSMTPVEALLASAAACSGMDVISILEKKRQVVTSYRVEIEHERGPEGTFPRPIVGVTVQHIIVGDNLDPVAVARAGELSNEKYCTVLATLRIPVAVTSTWKTE